MILLEEMPFSAMVDRLTWDLDGWIWVQLDSEESLSESTPTLVIDTDELFRADRNIFWAELEHQGFRSTIESRELFGYLKALERTPELRTKSYIVSAFQNYLDNDTWPIQTGS